MNPLNSGEKYQSIFAKMDKTKKSNNGGRFYQESLVEGLLLSPFVVIEYF